MRCPRCNRTAIGASQWCPVHGEAEDNIRPEQPEQATLRNICQVCGEAIGGGRASMALHLRHHQAYGAQMEMRGIA